jgi:hypothetical protein
MLDINKKHDIIIIVLKYFSEFVDYFSLNLFESLRTELKWNRMIAVFCGACKNRRNR